MKIFYIIVAIVILSCSCEDTTVEGVLVKDPVPALVQPQAAYSENAAEPVAKPKLLVQPRILTAQNSVNANESTSSPAPANNTKTTAAARKLIIDRIPRISPPKKPTDGNANGSNSSTTKKQVKIYDIKPNPQSLIAKKPVDDNLNLCAQTMCPMLYCENNLPAIPAQGICCQRCVTNPKCNTTACPKYKCVAGLLPANLTAGECCDRCAPVTVKPETTATKKSSAKPAKTTHKPKKHTAKPKKSRSSSSSSASEEDNSQSSSSEQHDGRSLGCNIRPFNPKPQRGHSHLIRLLTEALAHLRHHHSHGQHHHAIESYEKK